MPASEVYDYIDQKKWEIKNNGKPDSHGEVFVKECPFCQNDHYNFAINVSLEGFPFKCWACNKIGNLYRLKQELDGGYRMPRNRNMVSSFAGIVGTKEKENFTTYSLEWGQKIHSRLLNNEFEALDRLHERGLTDETIKRFSIGVTTTVSGVKNTSPHWVFPYIEDQKIKLVKYRSVPPAEKHISREEGMESVLYNIGNLDPSIPTVILCEGEIDAMSVWQSGHHNVISGSVGARTFRNEWIADLEKFEQIIIVYDQDEAGRIGREEITKRLGEERVLYVDFPEGMDANNVLVSLGQQALFDLIEAAKPAPLSGVTDLAHSLESLQEEIMTYGTLDRGLPWTWKEIDKVAGKLGEGQLWIINGRRGVGKSTFIRQQIYNWSVHDNIPCLYWCGEMSVKQTATALAQYSEGVTFEEISAEVLGSVYAKVKRAPLYIGLHTLKPNKETILEICTQAFKRYGCKVFCIDNLGLLTQGSQDPMMEEGRAAQEFNAWCIYYNTTIILLTHPRKMGERGDPNVIETVDDIKGNSNIPNFAAQVITLFRETTSPRNIADLYDKPKSIMDNKTAVIPLKGRFGGGTGRAWLYMEGEYSRFRDARPEDFIEERNECEH